MKGADHSENKIENTFALVLTVHQEAQPNSLSAFLIRKASSYSYNDVHKSRFVRAYLQIASKPQICKERFYSKVDILPELFAIIYVANTLNTSIIMKLTGMKTFLQH